MLGFTTLRVPLQDNALLPGVIAVFLAAFLAFFPVPIFRKQITLVQIITLGIGMIYGPTPAAWVAALGYLLAFILRKILPQSANFDSSLSITLFDISLQIVPLVVASYAFGWLQGVANQPDLMNIAPIRAASLAVVFVSGHAFLFLLDDRLQEQTPHPHYRREVISLLWIEALIIPFVLVEVIQFPETGVPALLVLAGIPVLLSLLTHSMGTTRADLDRRLQDLSMLHEISQIFRASISMETLLEGLRKQVTALMEIDSLYVALYEENDDHIWYPLAVKNGVRQYWSRRPMVEDRLTDRVIKERQAIFLPKDAEREMVRIGVELGEETLHAWVGVPLLTQNRVLGCLAVFSFSPDYSFTQSDLNVLTTLAGQVAVGLEYAVLYEQAQRRALQLESLIHDLRSPMATILTTLHIIEESIPPDLQSSEDIRQSLDIAQRGTKRVLRLVGDLLDIAQLETNDLVLALKPIKIKSVALDTIAEMQPQIREAHITLQNEIPVSLPSVQADKHIIQRIFTNLLDNALKFTPEGGEITVSADLETNKFVKVQVSDTGPGIPDEYAEQIFERFSQIPGIRGRRRGSGLGLAFCRLAIDAHGGQIWVDARPGGGSIFSFILPLNGPPPKTNDL